MPEFRATEGWDAPGFLPGGKRSKAWRDACSSKDLARIRDAARAALGRIYVRGRRVFLVKGRPAFDALLACLASVRQVPDPREAPEPKALGFAASHVTPVTGLEADLCGDALRVWRGLLDQEGRSGGMTASAHGGGSEIAAITARLNFLRQVLERSAGRKAIATAPYVVSPGDRAETDEILTVFPAGRDLPPLWEWFARLAAWMAGPRAAMRFVQSVGLDAFRAQEDAAYRAETPHLAVAGLACLCACDGRERGFPIAPLCAIASEAATAEAFAKEMQDLMAGDSAAPAVPASETAPSSEPT